MKYTPIALVFIADASHLFVLFVCSIKIGCGESNVHFIVTEVIRIVAVSQQVNSSWCLVEVSPR